MADIWFMLGKSGCGVVERGVDQEVNVVIFLHYFTVSD